jgi:hypothetical protein
MANLLKIGFVRKTDDEPDLQKERSGVIARVP